MIEIILTKEYITLGQLLKIGDFISSGAQAKNAVKTLEITVNDIKENRRGRKLYSTDIVKVEKQIFVIKPCLSNN